MLQHHLQREALLGVPSKQLYPAKQMHMSESNTCFEQAYESCRDSRQGLRQSTELFKQLSCQRSVCLLKIPCRGPCGPRPCALQSPARHSFAVTRSSLDHKLSNSDKCSACVHWLDEAA